MKALILAAGYATRLYPLTKEYPKSLLLVRGRPIIDYIIEKLEDINEIDEIIVITNSKFFNNFKAWKQKHHLKFKITVVDDLTKKNANRLGAIGDMNFAIDKKRIACDLLVIGGDNLFSGTLNKFLHFTKQNKENPVIGAFDIKRRAEASKYGVVRLNRNKQVVDFQEKPRQPKSTLIAMCLYYFPKNKLRLIKEYLYRKKEKKDAMGFYIDWLRSKEPVYGYVFSGKWFDIGDYKFYNAAKQAFAH